MDKIRDTRKKQQFVVDDEYLNGYARLCGIIATGVYLSLCRHANNEQRCFPSKKLIAEELDVGEASVYRAIKKLEEWHIILVEEQGRKSNGSFKNNLYILLDKSEWKPKPQITGIYGTVDHTDRSPQITDDIHRRSQGSNKDSHKRRIPIEGREEKPKFTTTTTIKAFMKNPLKAEKLIIWLKENYADIDVDEQICAFASYWSEQEADTGLERWQKESVFDIRLRVSNWFRRSYTPIKIGTNSQYFLVVDDLKFMTIEEVQAAQKNGKIYWNQKANKWIKGSI